MKRAEAGEHFTLTRDGTPVVEIAPSADVQPKKKLRGLMKGQIRTSQDFDELGPEWDEHIK